MFLPKHKTRSILTQNRTRDQTYELRGHGSLLVVQWGIILDDALLYQVIQLYDNVSEPRDRTAGGTTYR